ncbi:uncharacterized protein LOC113332427 [Papaver somniferum]|uniref:uncharacterized protein LOC113332427 n=1 Tax=Papaver somniferum TaxID=3469 RepID=UPI000E6F81FE|nr:uncharacterized protein LOC113332427 [Papaver somniferum]
MKQLGDLNYFLGIETARTDESILLTQKKYTLELLTKSNMLHCTCNTHVVKESIASIHDGILLDNPAEYRTIVGSLQYLTITRPDIAYGVNYVSQFMHALKNIHMLLVKMILRYLKGSINLGLVLIKGDRSAITAFTDSDWARSPDTRRSTSGYAIFMGNSLISWSSKKQPTVSRSSAEEDYKSLSVVASELEWLSNLFKELHISVTYPITILESSACCFRNPTCIFIHKGALFSCILYFATTIVGYLTFTISTVDDDVVAKVISPVTEDGVHFTGFSSRSSVVS